MPLGRLVQKAAVRRGLSAAAALTVLAAGAGRAQAQEVEGDPVSGDGKGVIGGALLGGEAVMLTMGAIGIDKTWPYLVFGGVGAVGGGIAGFFIEDSAPPAEVPLYMLAGGMALIIPTLVVTLNATAYKPPDTDQNQPDQNQPAGEPPRPAGSVQITTDAGPAVRKKAWRPAARAEAPRSAPIPRGLVDLDLGADRLALGVPAIELRPLYSPQEIFRFGVQQGEELRFPVLCATF